jgi:hypothetical protein
MAFTGQMKYAEDIPKWLQDPSSLSESDVWDEEAEVKLPAFFDDSSPSLS